MYNWLSKKFSTLLDIQYLKKKKISSSLSFVIKLGVLITFMKYVWNSKAITL